MPLYERPTTGAESSWYTSTSSTRKLPLLLLLLDKYTGPVIAVQKVSVLVVKKPGLPEGSSLAVKAVRLPKLLQNRGGRVGAVVLLEEDDTTGGVTSQQTFRLELGLKSQLLKVLRHHILIAGRLPLGMGLRLPSW